MNTECPDGSTCTDECSRNGIPPQIRPGPGAGVGSKADTGRKSAHLGTSAPVSPCQGLLIVLCSESCPIAVVIGRRHNAGLNATEVEHYENRFNGPVEGAAASRVQFAGAGALGRGRLRALG